MWILLLIDLILPHFFYYSHTWQKFHFSRCSSGFVFAVILHRFCLIVTLVTSVVKDMSETYAFYLIQWSLSVNRGHVFLCLLIQLIPDVTWTRVKYSVSQAFPEFVQQQRFIFPPQCTLCLTHFTFPMSLADIRYYYYYHYNHCVFP